MDNSDLAVHKHWATPLPASIALVGAGVVLIAAAAASYADAPALVFLGLAALLVTSFGVSTLVRRPRLTLLDGPVLRVKTLRGPRDLTVSDVERITVIATRHIVSRSHQLTIDLADDRLIVFGRWDLGADPSAVANDLAAAGFTVDDRR